MDLKTTQSIYTIMRLDTTKKNEVISDNGFFVIESPNTQWLLTRNIINDSFDITYLTKNRYNLFNQKSFRKWNSKTNKTLIL